MQRVALLAWAVGRLQRHGGRDAIVGGVGRLRRFSLVVTVGAVVTLLLCWAAGRLAQAPVIVRLDRRLFATALTLRRPSLDGAMLALTRIGDWPATLAVAGLAVVALCWWRRSWWPLLLGAAALAGEKLLQRLTEALVDSSPPPAVTALGHPGAFPSGGCARTLLVFGLIGWLATTGAGGRAALLGVGAAGTLAEGASRLYLGRHWPSDLVGGWLLGAAWLAVLVVAARSTARGDGRG